MPIKNPVSDKDLNSDHYFQKVFDVTSLIPVGRVTTYGAIADFLALGSARMVGWALNNCHSQDDKIPAHRVVNRLGELSGRNHFATPTLMQDRLEKEGVLIKDDKVVKMDVHFGIRREIADY
ncbi:MAG: MGMT family protein [Saprospiraceae bacterium]|nr:MGMT family protein [Saprospiraceae bacterium]